MASESDPLQLILAKLGAIEADLAKQETRHRDELAALQQSFEERLAFVEQSASCPTKKVSFETEDTPVLETTQQSGSGSSPSRLTPHTTRTPPEPTPIRSERLPDPPAFSGKKKDLPLFLTKLRYKLKGNADRFPNEESRLIYAHSRLERDPATLVDPLMDKDITTVEQLVQFLEATYGDPNRELTAWSRLDNLKQGKKNFLSHFADFRRLVADTNLNEGAQINQLRRSLSDELRRAMVGVLIPRSINDYANLIALYDNDLRYLPITRNPTIPKQQYPVDMEIDLNYAPAGSKEREDRRKKGLCFKCAQHGHISRDCSVPLPQTRASYYPNGSRSASPLTRNRRGSDLSSSTRSSSLSSRKSHSRSKNSRKGVSRG
jgi:hypothetical protein